MSNRKKHDVKHNIKIGVKRQRQDPNDIAFIKQNIYEGNDTLRFYKRNLKQPNLERKRYFMCLKIEFPRMNAYLFGELLSRVKRLFKEEGATKKVVNEASAIINDWAVVYGKVWES